MKRIFAAVAAAALLTGHAAAQTGSPAPKPGSSLTVGLPASSGSGPADVAFDEVDIFAMGPYASSPDDFAKEAAALEGPSGAAAVTPAMPPVMVLPTKRLKRFAYWRGASRVEDVLNHQVVITKPGELDTLDTVKKTYQKSTAFAIMPSFHFPAVQGASPQAKGPGTVDIALGLDAATTDPVANAGAVARGYAFTFTAKAENATGSCIPLAHFIDLRGTITSEVLSRPEPVAPAGTIVPFFTPETFAKLPFFDPAGCALSALTFRVTNVADLLAFGEFSLYRRIDVQPAATTGFPIRPAIISERGNIRDLTDADAVLFEVPADYTLVP